MKRFKSLEFGDAGGSDNEKGHGEALRDETYFSERAVECWLAGDFELALRNYSRALEKNNASLEAWAGQIMMLIELYEYPEAIVWSDKALEFFPEHPELFALKAIAFSRDAKSGKAMAFSDNSVSKEDVTPRVWLARAEVLMKRKPSIAETCLSKAISIAGNKTDIIRFEAGRLLKKCRKYSSALEHLSSSVRVFPKSALAWYELGSCQAKLGFAEANVALEQCLNLRPYWDLAEAQLRKVKKRGFLRRLFRKIFRG
jgi:tetratricopeptide (TPR) repeat protein